MPSLKRDLLRCFRAALTALFLTAGLLLAVPSDADAAPISYRIEGGGYGHGVGMSQYGAKGMADSGHPAGSILRHYYQNTSVQAFAMRPEIRVGLLQSVGQVTLRSAGAISGDGRFQFRWSTGHRNAVAGEVWQVRADGDGFRLYRNGSVNTDKFTGVLHVGFQEFGSLLKVDETGDRYRWGTLDIVHKNTAAFDVVAAIGSYQAYLYGLGEVPSSWPSAALEAQAIAGRTYALDKAIRLGDIRSGCSCTVYSSTVDQAYVGYDKESGPSGARWVSAVDATSSVVVTYGGAPIQAYYSSSSGGHTENVDFVWGGDCTRDPKPATCHYLKGVPDPGDATASNPNHRWSRTYTAKELSDALAAGGIGVGQVLDVTTPAPYGVSGRIGRVVDPNSGGVTIAGTGSTRRVAGSTFRQALGLKSTLFKVTKLPGHPNGTILQAAGDPRVWVMRDGVRWQISSASAFESRASWSEIVQVSSSTLNAYPEASAGYRDGSLIGSSDGRVYVVSDQRRRWISSETVFKGLGFSFSNVKWVDADSLKIHPEGDPVTSTAVIPNGVMVQVPGDQKIYLVKNQSARHLLTEPVFYSYRVPWAEVAPISEAQMTALGGRGPAIGFRDGTLLGSSDGKISVVSDGLRRWITSQEAFQSMGYEFADVIYPNSAESALNPQGPVLDKAPHPDGALIKNPSSPVVWLVIDGVRWPIANESAFNSRASWSEILTVPDSLISMLPAIGVGWREGSLVGTPDGRVYLISDSTRRWINSETIFRQLGLSFSNVRWVTYVQAAVHPEGTPITSSSSLPNGMFVRATSSPKLYLVSDGRLRHVLTEAVFNSYRASWSEVAVVTEQQMSSHATTSPAVFRDGSLLGSPDGRVWAISDGKRRWIISEGTFISLGYKFSNVVWISDPEMQLHPEGEPIGS